MRYTKNKIWKNNTFLSEGKEKGKERFIEQLGERRLIETIVNKFNANANRRIVTVGAGEDDCAVIDVDSARGGVNISLSPQIRCKNQHIFRRVFLLFK